MSARSIQLPEWQIQPDTQVNYQSTAEALVQDTLRIQEGTLADSGALVIKTGAFTGRSPKDKFLVRDALTDQTV
ncbi:MAG: phosphoenolpyruvate carboxykinase (ATP), partial [Bacteroidota bacterium]